MAKIMIKTATEHDAKYLHAECGVRYWEDAKVNGVADEDGTLIPFRDGDAWCPVIEIDTGVIVGWPKGVVADLHFGPCPPELRIPVQITGYIDSIYGHDDGTSQEFNVIVTSVRRPDHDPR